MAIIKTREETEILRESGRRLATILDEVIQSVRPGITPIKLDRIAEQLIREGGDEPAFLHYKPRGARSPYPASLCVSANDNVVHGVPGNQALKEGDIVGLDLGLRHVGMITDMAVTVPVGVVDKGAIKLMEVTQKALDVGIKEARAGNRVSDIGHAIETRVKSRGFSVVRELGGHGVGRGVHEEPFVPNFGKKGTGEELKEGMALAIEPIVNEGSGEVILTEDGYTIKTKDGKRSAHFEHTILITKKGAEIITVL